MTDKPNNLILRLIIGLEGMECQEIFGKNAHFIVAFHGRIIRLTVKGILN